MPTWNNSNDRFAKQSKEINTTIWRASNSLMAKLIFNNSCVQRAQLAVASLGYLLQRRGTQWSINSANRNETMWISQRTQRLCNDDRKTFYLESKQSL